MANVFRGINTRLVISTVIFPMDLVLGEKISTLHRISRIFKKKKMKNILKIIVFQIGVDVLGFPKTHEHKLVFGEKFYKKFNK